LSVLPVLIATAAVRPVAKWYWGILVVSALGVMLLHAMGNLLNDYFDFRSGVDRKVEGDEGRPGRLLVRGELTPREIFIEAMTCFLLGVPLAVYLIWTSGPGLLWFGLAAALALYVYTGPPFRLKYRALGEVLIFLVFGPLLTVGAAYAQTGGFEWLALILSVPVGVVTTAVLLGNNIRDMEEDKAAGIRTLAHSMGARAARTAYALGVLVPPLAVACLVAAGVLRVSALVCLISRAACERPRLPDLARARSSCSPERSRHPASARRGCAHDQVRRALLRNALGGREPSLVMRKGNAVDNPA
jgi:1,4-dihydroxy-2-naphthoate octaprenyltransferase